MGNPIIAELHLTYACDLSCMNCNRGCFVKPKYAPDMSLNDLDKFLDQIIKNKLHLDHIGIIGGEPTLHPQCLDFLKLTKSKMPGLRIELLSNGHSKRAKDVINEVKKQKLAEIKFGCYKEKRIDGVDVRWEKRGEIDGCGELFVSPYDLWGTDRTPCHWHSHRNWCGYSVDSLGYTVCNIGGMIDSILKLNVRTQNLMDIYDPKFVEWQTKQLCRHCGAFKHELFRHDSNTELSKTWYKAIKNINIKKKWFL